MNNQVVKGLAITVLILFFTTIPMFALAGFGISPPEIEETHLVRGATIERTIYLVQGNPERDVEVNVETDSDKIKDWISYTPGFSFVIPKGIQQFPLNVKIKVPENAEFGIYKAYIRINTVPKKADSAGEVAIALGGRVDVDLTVGEGIFKEFKIRTINILDVRAGKDPKASITIENSGNVSAGPQAASFELFNKFGNVRLAYSEIGKIEEIPAFSEKNILLSFPIDVRLAEGEYWGHVKVYNESGNVMKELRTVFNVKKGLPINIWIMIGGGALILLGIITFLYKKIRRKNRRT